MKLSSITREILDSECDRVEFQRHQIGLHCYGVRVFTNEGDDYLLPETYKTLPQVNNAIVALNFALNMGARMKAKRIAARVTKMVNTN